MIKNYQFIRDLKIGFSGTAQQKRDSYGQEKRNILLPFPNSLVDDFQREYDNVDRCGDWRN